MATLIRVESKATQLVSERNRAQQNALLGLHMALGKLQASLGADQRVTARADLDSVPEASRMLTGVWSTDPADFGDVDPRVNPAAIKSGAALQWLVSEAGADASDFPSNFSLSSSDAVVLYSGHSASDSDGAVVLNSRPIDANNYGLGHYAWYVADEGMKASVRSQRSTGTTYHNQQVLNPTGAGLEVLAAPDVGSPLLDSLTESQIEAAKVIRAQLASDDSLSVLLSSSYGHADNGAFARRYFHDLTLSSLGVMSDVRAGGLKRDLTAAFSDDTEFQKLLDEWGVGPYEDQMFPPFTHSSQQASLLHGDPGGPLWAQMRSFFQDATTTGALSSSKNVSPHTSYVSGVRPVVAQWQMHYHLYLKDDLTPRYCVMPVVVLWNPTDVTLAAGRYVVSGYDRFADPATEAFEDFRYDRSPGVWVDYDSDPDPNVSTVENIAFFTEGQIKSGTISGAGAQNTTVGFDHPMRPLSFLLEGADGEGISLEPGQAIVFSPVAVDALVFPNSWSDPVRNVMRPGFRYGAYFYQDFPIAINNTDPVGGSGDPVDPSRILGVGLLQTVSGAAQFVLGQGETLEAALAAPLWAGGGSKLAHGHYKVRDQSPGYADESHFGSASGVGFWGNPGAGSVALSVHDVRNLANLTRAGDAPFAPGGDGTMRGFPTHGHGMYLKSLENYASTAYPAKRRVVTDFSPLAQRVSLPRYMDTNGDWNAYLISEGAYLELQEPPDATINGNTLSDPLYSSDLYDEGVPEFPVGFSNGFSTSSGRWVLQSVSKPRDAFVGLGVFRDAFLSQPIDYDRDGRDDLAADLIERSLNFAEGTSPTHVIGSSYAPPAMGLDQLATSINASGDTLAYYDMSYLLNDVLWDAFFMSNYTSDGSSLLSQDRLQLDSELDAFAYESSATNLLVEGVFNVNSTSVAAWKAFLASGLSESVIRSDGSEDSMHPQTAFLASARPLGPQRGGATNNYSEQEGVFDGFLGLSEAELEALAVAMVDQVKKRGPFVSMSHFVNRVPDHIDYRSAKEDASLEIETSGVLKTERATGALQAAIDLSGIQGDFDAAGSRGFDDYSVTLADYDGSHSSVEIPGKESLLGHAAAGNPGYLTQGLVLAKLGHRMAVRSDTFKIRSYGDSGSAIDGSIGARAYLEATVQRLPSYIRPEQNEAEERTATLTADNARFGRRFVITSLRWLSEDEI
ncbi:hypothetical protein QEH52_10470 [Coraliomargarita sp. SDUM461003]|uniref:Uncharacterized protein n=1 Tax=Thalassobacterium maritimum TaxID=3041265 RepID=A0ABU1AY93_9BACT|nr:hypothetical protein [Coraliomargarita sp. SDUM461003]MDQ8207937.1 hypothetical protein [Coraliomargarita sp. SDUM461003]